MKPPYQITSSILTLISGISEKLGVIKASQMTIPRTELRKSNRIKTIHGSLQIEGNTLNLDQVTALMENKRVIAPLKDILEVQNAIHVYDELQMLKPSSLASFMKAHGMLMKGLIKTAGKFRSGGAGIVKGDALKHLAPKAEMVGALMKDLFNYLKKDNDPLLIKSCVFHYELEFIHPFEDGNGRMGRLWQTIILQQLNPIFAYLPVESLIRNQQADYYRALENSDNAGHSTQFIEFMLETIDKALEEQLHQPVSRMSPIERISFFRHQFPKKFFSRKDYMKSFRQISMATASRDLKWAVEAQLIKKMGDKRTTQYLFSDSLLPVNYRPGE